LLLDTHALLWWLADDPTLSDAARAAIALPENEVLVSAASAWEISIKVALGKLSLPGDLEEAIVAEGFRPLPFAVRHAVVAGSLPRHHDDPFDRALVAQAQLEHCSLVTRDERIRRYGVSIVDA
jgi:PIN domain nuclease of toxin-antitoxin system